VEPQPKMMNMMMMMIMMTVTIIMGHECLWWKAKAVRLVRGEKEWILRVKMIDICCIYIYIYI
jgi:hypothetical protein